MDYSLFKALNGASARLHVLDPAMVFLANELPVLLVIVVALLFLIPWRHARRERRRAAVSATAALALALLVNQPIAAAVGRMRPYVTHPHTHLLIARSQDPSFPSDHATGAFAIATSVWLYDRRFGAVLFVLAAVLAVSRVYVGTHYPGDVAGGALIGLAVALTLHTGLVEARARGSFGSMFGTLGADGGLRLGPRTVMLTIRRSVGWRTARTALL